MLSIKLEIDLPKLRKFRDSLETNNSKLTKNTFNPQNKIKSVEIKVLAPNEGKIFQYSI